MFICSTLIMKYLFARHEYENMNVHLKHKNYEKVKILFAIQELWKYFVCNTWIWNIKMFVCNTWIMKYLNICCQYMNYENIF